MLVLREFPWTQWGFGLGLCLFWALLTFHFALGRNRYGSLIVHEENMTWWMVLLIFFTGMMALITIHAGKQKTTVIDRRLKYIELTKTSILCMESRNRNELVDLQSVTLDQRGWKGVTHCLPWLFEVKATFKGHLQPIVLFESRKKDRAARNFMRIKLFLNLPVEENELDVLQGLDFNRV